MRKKIALGLLGLVAGGLLMAGSAHAYSPYDRYQFRQQRGWENQRLLQVRARQIAQNRCNRDNRHDRRFYSRRFNNYSPISYRGGRWDPSFRRY